jgi:hypothetical protein
VSPKASPPAIRPPAEGRARRVGEVAAVLLTAALHFVFYDLLDLRGVFIALALVGWTTYVVVHVRRDPGRLAAYGLGRQGLRASAQATAVVLAVGAAACLAIGLVRGTVVVRPTLLLLAALYPLWGLVQEVLVQSMVVRNLEGAAPRVAIVLVAGALFGVVHLPHLALAAATALMGAVFAAVFLRTRNVLPLALAHGWLGVLFYAWVLGRDPWREVFG